MRMKTILILLILTVTLASQNLAQSPPRVVGQIPERTPAQEEAFLELNATARAYREGNFAEAQKHAEKALVLDPASRAAPSFLARTIHAQYQPGERDEANLAKAREAIEAYKQVLARDPKADEAYKAIAYFYGALKEDELLREWVYRRAQDSTVSDEKRAEAFIVLASKDWDCSFRITELPTNKITTLKGQSTFVQYIKPTDSADFERARQCSTRGLNMVEMAITLLPGSERAWEYKVQLLLESAKLAEMDNNIPLKSDYERLLKHARSTTETLRAISGAGNTPKP